MIVKREKIILSIVLVSVLSFNFVGVSEAKSWSWRSFVGILASPLFLGGKVIHKAVTRPSKRAVVNHR